MINIDKERFFATVLYQDIIFNNTSSNLKIKVGPANVYLFGNLFSLPILCSTTV